MPCCLPEIKAVLSANYAASNLTDLADDSRYGSTCTFPQVEQNEWRFFKNGVLAHTIPMAPVTDPMPFGTGTHGSATTPNGIDDVTDYLALQGVTFGLVDVLDVAIRIRSCAGKFATSNKVRLPLVVIVPLWAFQTATGITGTTVPIPAAFQALPPQSWMLFVNGGKSALGDPDGFNIVGTDAVLVNPLDPADEVLFLRIDAVPNTLLQSTATGIAGATVAAPPTILPGTAANLMVWRNPLKVRAVDVTFTATDAVLDAALPVSDTTDVWQFTKIDTGAVTFTAFQIAAFAGNTLALPSGITAANQDTWILFKNGDLQYRGSGSLFGYTNSGSNALLIEAATLTDQYEIIKLA